MTRRRCGGPAGEIGERDRDAVGEVVGEAAEARAEDDPGNRLEVRPGSDGTLEGVKALAVGNVHGCVRGLVSHRTTKRPKELSWPLHFDVISVLSPEWPLRARRKLSARSGPVNGLIHGFQTHCRDPSTIHHRCGYPVEMSLPTLPPMRLAHTKRPRPRRAGS